MTYNWNNMVSIKVPTGTNGWLYSGEVIINGVKVRFPVGVPTSVPEPAAVLLKKMIELEQEEDANTAKPQNHYVGDVTIPAGKTLTLEKGAKFVDNSGPSEVVILPETELTYDESDDSFYLTTLWTVEPVAGGMYVVTYNGVDYECESLAYAVEGAPDGMVLMGDASLAGQSGGNADAPFCLLCIPNGMGMGSMLMNKDGATSVTLSIVQTEGAASGGASDSPVFVVKVSNSGGYTADKTYDETLAAMRAGKLVYFMVTGEGLISATAQVSYFMDKIIATFDQTLNNQKLHWSSDGSLELRD